jgi:UDP-N-acetyl-2-amino-2-deoxyglucuronate dehydrogenase
MTVHGRGFRIGVIGAGQAGERQAVGFAAHPEAHVVGVADLDETRATALAGRFDADAVRDWRDLFALGLDVLVVATPHDLHVEPAEMAAAHGVHVMMEKPIATTLDDAMRIVDVTGEAGVALTVSFVHRFREEARRAKAWVDAAGPLQVGRETMATRRTPTHPRWLTSARAAGGGVLMYSAIHGVDRLRWWFDDEVVEVTARSRRYTDDNTEVEDGIAVLLQFAGGGCATLTANAPTYPADPAVWETEVHGARAMVRMRTRGFAETSGRDGAERYVAGQDEETARPHYNFERQAADLLAAIAAGRAPAVSGTDGIRALEVCLAAYRSAETGRPVEVEAFRKGGRT